MIPELGHFALALAVALAFAQGVIGVFAPGLRDPRAMRAAPLLALSHFLAIGAAFLALIYAGVVSDFTVENVADFSSSLVPLIYRISGTWGNHDGSMVLWCFILSLCGATVAAFGGNLPASLRARVIGVLGLVSGGFLLFTLTVSDPFTRIWPPPLDGAGVNPILQDPGLAFHPPVLYTGYVGFSVAFAFAIAALIEGRIDAAWGRWVRPWALISWCFLTAGITLGSWWSYYTLGWGGYWFWDPVENAALLPWLTGTALLHCAIVVEKRESLKAWTVLLAIATFSLSLSGTFLVRSGILNSVHSFAAAPDQGLFILALLGLTVGGSLLLFAIRAPALAAAGVYAPLSRESALVVNNIFLCSIAAVVFVGTLYPPFSDLLFGVQLSVGAPFFNQTVLPLTAPLILAMAVGPLLPWKRAALKPALERIWLAAVAAIIVMLVMTEQTNAITALGLGGGVWVVLSALSDIAERTKLGRVGLGDSVTRLRAMPRAAFGAALGHIGFGVLVLGIAGMTLATQKVVVLNAGQSADLGGYSWTLNDIHDAPGPNYAQRVADVTISDNGKAFLTLHPSRRMFTTPKVITNDAAINTNGFQDIYVVFADEPASGGAELRLNRHPLAPEIWFGGLIMALGGALSLSDRRLRVGAPARKKKAKVAGVAAE
ncbi:MAG: c-type cytochrome biogenesis protein CcmF [Acidocella sp. 20-57-95]|nr:MAG: c-type cytochrome biogenesis protein CcmF [Acidocella sp. 20-57-95]OYV61111.1 MAG: c-type cytochrome biogenesis protein CcmF [Acidocella sp. 21-58-7]HQT65209.1 heme lyase CcmF/NrfE family subunit [Acidocella sp.]HQU04512.1 heme lyase CcmF/NrfE family subunit [Acidocella sp.]